MIDLDDPNIFKPDGEYQVYEVQDHKVIQIRCPHCQTVGAFSPAIKQYLSYAKGKKEKSRARFDVFEAHIRMCPNPDCRCVVFTITHFGDSSNSTVCFPPELLNFNPENLPTSLTTTLKEAVLCHSQGAYRASAMMVRRLLEELCHDCGVQGQNLHARLKALRSQITLPEDLFDAMDELKALGNDAAHIEAKAFEVVDEEESRLSIELAQEILKARYQHKSLVERLRARKRQP